MDDSVLLRQYAQNHSDEAFAALLAMTTLQKIIIGTVLVTAVGTGIYQAQQASALRAQVQVLEEQREPGVVQLSQLTRERDELSAQIAALRQENQRLQQAQSEVPRLRGEIARLQALERTTQSNADLPESHDPFSQSVLALVARAAELNQHWERMPEKKIPELQFLNEHHWLDAARDADLQTDAGIRKALSKLRSLAKHSFAAIISPALDQFIQAHQGQLPTEMSELKPYLKEPVDDSILDRYEIIRTGHVKDLPKDPWVISEKRPVDRDYDSHLYIAPEGRTGSWGTGLHSSGDPDPNWVSR